MNKKIYTRQYYIDKIRGFYNSDLIKVISGIRRCGKSCFLLSVMEDLKAQGVKEKDILILEDNLYRKDDKEYQIIKTDNTSVVISDHNGYNEYINKDDIIVIFYSLQIREVFL